MNFEGHIKTAMHIAFAEQVEKSAAMDPSLIGSLKANALPLAAMGGIPLTYMMTRHHDEQEKNRAKNMSYGAGVATGMAAPRIIRGLADRFATQQPMQQPMSMEQPY